MAWLPVVLSNAFNLISLPDCFLGPIRAHFYLAWGQVRLRVRLVYLVSSPGAWCDTRALQISWPGSYVEHGDLLFLLVHFVLVLLGY